MSNMSSKDSRTNALEELKAKRLRKAANAAGTSKPDPDDEIPGSPPPRILAPASSPAPGRTSVSETSPRGVGSKFFDGQQDTQRRHPGKSYNDAFLGDDYIGSLNRSKPARQERDKTTLGEMFNMIAPTSSSSTSASNAPSPMSSSGIDRDERGQAVKKRAMTSREGSEFSTGLDMSGLDVNTRNGSPATPGGLSRTSSVDMGTPGKTSTSSLPETPVVAGGLSRFKHRVAVGSPTPSPRSSQVSNPSLGLVSSYKTLWPGLRDSQIENAMIAHGSGDRKSFIYRLDCMAQGRPYHPPAPKALGPGGNPSAARALANPTPNGDKVPSYLPKTDQHIAAQAAGRADMKQKSAIYANRRVDGANGRNPSPVKPSEAGAKRRRADDSGSDAEWSDGSDVPGRKGKRSYGVEVEDMDESNALKVFNTCEPAELTGSIVCSEEQAKIIISLRPFESVQDLRTRLQKKRGVSVGLFEQYMEVMQGYIQVDRCLNKCESIGKEVLDVMRLWSGGHKGGELARSRTSSPEGGSQKALGLSSQDTGMHIASVDAAALRDMADNEMDVKKRRILKSYKSEPPAGLAKGVKLKDYQVVGVNWLNMMYDRQLSCILADEMGLGKTFQVIAFLASLRSRGKRFAHLIMVPSSTLENWVREFQRFAPEIDVQTYYGSQKEREELRYQLKEQHRAGELEVLLTTYDLAFRPDDQKFLRKKLDFETCIYDEGHTLKNYNSLRYTKLIEIRPRWRLLLTGTPLQNNLQELVSLLKFIHEDIFDDAEASLRQIFKVHAKGVNNLLSAQRVSRARTMMTPFVLRRRKAQVLQDLPVKTESKVSCPMEKKQETLYNSILERSRDVLVSQTEEELEQAALNDDEDDGKQKTKAKAKKDQAKQKASASSNILMDLRKAAIHPLLFRRIYDDKVIRKMARDCMKEEEFMTSEYDLIIEDMEYMTDSELYDFAVRYDSVRKYAKLCEDAFFQSAKTAMLIEKLEQCKKEGRRMLLFSQFTQVLNILQVVLGKLNTRYLRLDGSTKVDERQTMVDEFTEDEDIKVFLLSTRAGGMGINLVAASMVVIFDQDFNPHNDKQAMDRAYRIGQTRDVLVYKFITTDTIEEEIFTLGETKLQLDNAVGGIGGAVDADGKPDQQTANDTKKSLMKTIRQRVVEGPVVSNEKVGDITKPQDGVRTEDVVMTAL